METIFLSINGKKVACPSGESILTAAEQNGIYIPTLCHHPDLKPYGACRLCLVEDEKSGRLMASCVTPAAPDMTVLTDSPRVVNHRKNIVRLMIAEHPESCIVCSKGNRCDLRKIAARLGVAESNLYPMPNFKPYEAVNPFIVRDLSKCILCGKCIRADHELVATGAIDYNNRGFPSRPATLYEQPLESSTCTFCGTCVSMCPTGALSTKNNFFVGTPEKETDSICGFCGAGCSLSLGAAGGRIMECNPARTKGTVNIATLCVRGHFANDFLNTADRLTQPLLRTNESNGTPAHQATAWDTAIALVAGKMAEIKRKHGPKSIAFVGSSKCTNEENYLFQKIARALFETNNITNSGQWNGQALLAQIEERTFGTARVSPLSDLENADAILTVCADTDHTVPVAGYHIKRAARKQTPLIVIDARRTELDRFATARLRPVSGTGALAGILDIINALASCLLASGGEDARFVEHHTKGFAAYRDSVSATDVEQTAVRCGLSKSAFEKAAAQIAGKQIAFVLNTTLLEQAHGQAVVDAVFNLALATGSLSGSKGCFYLLSGENNTNGAFDMGTVPDCLPGRRRLSDDAARSAFENAWGTKISPDPGLSPLQLIEAVESGEIKALYIMGENLVRSLPQPERVTAALEKLEFLVVQDIVFTRTAKLADVVLSGAAFAEKNGSFTNMEGRIQAFTTAVQPPGESLPDWMILGLLAKRMGYPEQYTTIETIRHEIRRVIPMYAAMGSHRREWVKNADAHTPLSDPNLKFEFTPVAPQQETPAADTYPLTAVIGSLRWHLGGGTRTSRSERITELNGKGAIQIAPEDGETLGIADNDRIRVASKNGALERTAVIQKGMPAGHVFVPQGFSGNDALHLSDLNWLDQPASGWRTCRVSIEKI